MKGVILRYNRMVYLEITLPIRTSACRYAARTHAQNFKQLVLSDHCTDLGELGHKIHCH